MSADPNSLADRYKRPSSKLRPTTIALAGLGLIGFFSFAIYANFLGKPLASAEVLSYKQIDSTHMGANFVALTGSKAATCSFKAFATRGIVVGYSEVKIPANNDDSKIFQVIVKTLEPASVLKTEGCRVK